MDIDSNWPLAKLRPHQVPTSSGNPVAPSNPAPVDDGRNRMNTKDDPPRPPSPNPMNVDALPRPASREDNTNEMLVDEGDSQRPTVPANSEARQSTVPDRPKRPKPTKRKWPIPEPRNGTKSRGGAGSKGKRPRLMDEFSPHQHIGSGSYLEPIDLEAYLVSFRALFF